MSDKKRYDSLESMLKELETVVSQIAEPNLELKKSADLYNHGMSLYEKCFEELASYKEKISILESSAQHLEEQVMSSFLSNTEDKKS